MGDVVNMFGKAKEHPTSLETDELLAFKQIIEQSLDSFHQLSPMDKFNLYNELAQLVFIMMHIIHPELNEENKDA